MRMRDQTRRLSISRRRPMIRQQPDRLLLHQSQLLQMETFIFRLMDAAAAADRLSPRDHSC